MLAPNKTKIICTIGPASASPDIMLPVWIAAISTKEATCHGLQFSYGVFPVYTPEHSKERENYE